jgi:hypothetical protein
VVRPRGKAPVERRHTMSEILITVDLGAVNVYEVIRDPLKMASDRLETIKSYVTAEPRLKASEKFSDSAGRFYQGGGSGGASAGVGEQHNIELETEKRVIKLIAGDINELIAGQGRDNWYLAADRNINNQILELLKPEVKAKLRKNVAADLTKASKLEIMEHFAEDLRKSA